MIKEHCHFWQCSFSLYTFAYDKIEFNPKVLGSGHPDDGCHLCVFIHTL